MGTQSPAMAVTLARLFPSLRFVVQTCETGPGIPTARFSVSSTGDRIFPPAMAKSKASGAKLAELPPQVRSRITLHERIHTTSQSVKNAAVYIIRLPSPSPSAPLDSVMSRAATALNAHIDVLRTSPESRLVLTALVLPAPGTVDLDSEVAARLGDLCIAAAC